MSQINRYAIENKHRLWAKGKQHLTTAGVIGRLEKVWQRILFSLSGNAPRIGHLPQARGHPFQGETE